MNEGYYKDRIETHINQFIDIMFATNCRNKIEDPILYQDEPNFEVTYKEFKNFLGLQR